jgi:MFS family permease
LSRRKDSKKIKVEPQSMNQISAPSVFSGVRSPFYALVITQTISLIGSHMTSVAIGIRVSVDTGQAAPLLLVAFFNELPPMLFGSAAGVLIDRWERKRVMILADAGQALGSLLLMVSFLSGQFQLWHLYAVAFMQGVFAMFQGPAQDAVVTMLVPEARRDRANALRQMAFPLAGVIAPTLTGLLYPFVRIQGIILIDMATFLVAVVIVLLAHIPNPEPSAEGGAASGGFWHELRGGLQYVSERRALLWLILYFTAMNFLLNGPLGLTIPYIIRITGSESLTGLILSAMNGGALAGAVAIALRRPQWPRVHIFLTGFLLTGVMFLIYGISRQPFLLAGSLFILMIPLPLGWGLFTSLLQSKTPPDIQGRIFAFMGQLGFVASTSSFLLTGLLVDHVLEPAAEQPGAGISLVLVVTGVVILFITLVTIAVRSIRRVETELPDYEAPTIEQPLAASTIGS